MNIKLFSYKELTTKDLITPNAIKFGSKEGDPYPEFSNFNILPKSSGVIVDEFGLVYNTIENYYQACKSVSYEVRQAFTRISPNESKRKGNEIFIRENWDVIKYDVMREALRQKFSIKEYADLLDSTSDCPLIEWTSWNDKVWGMWDADKSGCNALGKLLQERRMLNRLLLGNSFL